jgi:hypothetical protein
MGHLVAERVNCTFWSKRHLQQTHNKVYEEVTKIASDNSTSGTPQAWQASFQVFSDFNLPVFDDPGPSALTELQWVRRGSSKHFSRLAPLSPKRFSMV